MPDFSHFPLPGSYDIQDAFLKLSRPTLLNLSSSWRPFVAFTFEFIRAALEKGRQDREGYAAVFAYNAVRLTRQMFRCRCSNARFRFCLCCFRMLIACVWSFGGSCSRRLSSSESALTCSKQIDGVNFDISQDFNYAARNYLPRWFNV